MGISPYSSSLAFKLWNDQIIILPFNRKLITYFYFFTSINSKLIKPQSLIRINYYLKKISPAALLLVLPFLSFYFVEKQNLNIVFIGDSITDGAYLGNRDEVSPPARAVAYLKQQSGIEKVKFFNQGISGYTTLDFLPPASAAFSQVIKTADGFYEDKQASLIFSIMLGTNDSAIEGTNGAPVSPQSYSNNMKTIIDSLLRRYPESKVSHSLPIVVFAQYV